MKRSILMSCVALSALGTFATSAHAQDQAATPPAAASPAAASPAAASSDASPDIIVTARRKEESLQSVPVAITAMSQKDLTERSINSATDLSKISTGLVITADQGNPSVVNFSIRGRGQQYGAATGSVETYFADIPLSSTFEMPAPPPQFFDLTTLQVLKGPQGTLFGRNTTGGAVVIVPQAPKLGVTEGYFRVQGGTYNDFQTEGAINVPLGDKAALRVAFFDWQRKGYINSSATDVNGQVQTDLPNGGTPLGSQNFNNADTSQFRASLYVQPTDTVENTTIAAYIIDKNRSSASIGLLQGPRTAPTASNPFGVTVAAAPSCGDYCSYINTNLERPASHYFLVENTTKIDVAENLKIKNILGFIYSTGYGNVGIDSTGTSQTNTVIDLPTPPRAQKNTQFTEELQLQGSALDDALTYTVGGLYDDTAQPRGYNDINFYSLSFSGAASDNLTAINYESTQVRNKSGYVSFSYSPIKALNITGGFRRTWVDLEQDEGRGASQAGLPFPTVPGALVTSNGTFPNYFGGIVTQQASFAGSTYNLGVDYHFAPNDMVYAGYRHGWKRGGINPSNATDASFGGETVDDFTLGVKSKFKVATVPVRFNLELFHDEYYGMQTAYIELITIDSAPQLQTATANVPKVRYQGLDADISALVTDWLDLSGSWSYNDAKIKHWVIDSVDLSTNPVPYNIKNKFSATARLHNELPNSLGEGVVLFTVNKQTLYYTNAYSVQLPPAAISSFYFNNASSFCAGGLCSETIPGYTTADLRIELNHAFGSRFDLAASATNLTNKFYFTGSSSTLLVGAEGYSVAPPRMFTFEIRTKF